MDETLRSRVPHRPTAYGLALGGLAGVSAALPAALLPIPAAPCLPAVGWLVGGVAGGTLACRAARRRVIEAGDLPGRTPWYLRSWWWPPALLWFGGVFYLAAAGPAVYLYEFGLLPTALREPVELAMGPATMLGEPPRPVWEWYARYLDSFRVPTRRYYKP